jgi:hypothetical protein
MIWTEDLADLAAARAEIDAFRVGGGLPPLTFSREDCDLVKSEANRYRRSAEMAAEGRAAAAAAKKHEAAAAAKRAAALAARGGQPLPSPLERITAQIAAEEAAAELGASYEPTAFEAQWLAKIERDRQRQSTLAQLVANRAADKVDVPTWQKAAAARQQLNDDSIWVASMLSACGQTGFKSRATPRACVLDLLSGLAQDLPHTVGKVFIPCEAARKRARTMIATEYWMTRHPQDRFWVFHGPGRVLVTELRATIKKIQRRLSKLNNEPFMRAAGIVLNLRVSEIGDLTFLRRRSRPDQKIEEIVTTAKNGRVLARLFRAAGESKGREVWLDKNEVETVEHRDAAGNWTFFPHVNVLAHFTKGPLPKNAEAKAKFGSALPLWPEFLSQLQGYWQWGMRECGGLAEIREAIKYCFKPADIRRMTAPEVGALAAAMFRLHTAQPLGMLRDEIKARKNAPEPLKLTRWRNKGTGALEIRVKKCWNSNGSRAKRPAAARALPGQDLMRFAPEAVEAHNEKMRAETERINRIEQRREEAGIRPTINRVLARMVATSPFVPRVGPQVVVLNYGHTAADYEQVCRLPFVRPMLEATGVPPERIGTPPIKVHTSPVIVRAGPDPFQMRGLDTREAWEKPAQNA